MLRLRVELRGEGPYRLAAIGQKRGWLRLLPALGVQHGAPRPLGFGVVALHEAKTFGRLFSRHRLAPNNLEVMLLLLPVPDIPAVESHAEGFLGVRQRPAVSRAAVYHDSLVLSQLFLAALSHGKGVIVGGGRVQRLIYWE